MKNEKYIGFTTPTPAFLNPKKEKDLYAFSGIEVSRGDSFAAVFRALTVPGFVTPQEFAADMAATGNSPHIYGKLELFAPEFVMCAFRYCRSDGTTATARGEETMELSPPELLPPTRTPSLSKPKKPSTPPPSDEGIDMSF